MRPPASHRALFLGLSEPKEYTPGPGAPPGVHALAPVFVMTIVAEKDAPGATIAGAVILTTPAPFCAKPFCVRTKPRQKRKTFFIVKLDRVEVIDLRG